MFDEMKSRTVFIDNKDKDNDSEYYVNDENDDSYDNNNTDGDDASM